MLMLASSESGESMREVICEFEFESAVPSRFMVMQRHIGGGLHKSYLIPA